MTEPRTIPHWRLVCEAWVEIDAKVKAYKESRGHRVFPQLH